MTKINNRPSNGAATGITTTAVAKVGRSASGSKLIHEDVATYGFSLQLVVKVFDRSGATTEERIAMMMSELENMVRAKVQVEHSRQSGVRTPNPVFWTTGLSRVPGHDLLPAIGMDLCGRYGVVCV